MTPIKTVSKTGVTVTARITPGPHGPLWEVTDGLRYRALLPTCSCDREGCPKVTIGVGGRRGCRGGRGCDLCHSGWHEPIAERLVKAAAATHKRRT